jgi:hypothetical protein
MTGPNAATAASTTRPNPTTVSSSAPITCSEAITPPFAGTGSASAASPARLTGAVSIVSGNPRSPSTGGCAASVGSTSTGKSASSERTASPTRSRVRSAAARSARLSRAPRSMFRRTDGLSWFRYGIR